MWDNKTKFRAFSKRLNAFSVPNKLLTIRATNNVLNGSSVQAVFCVGSHIAISRSSLYATCSAFSLRRRSRRSSRVSTRVGGGVSSGFYQLFIEKCSQLDLVSIKDNCTINKYIKLNRRHYLEVCKKTSNS